MARITEAAEATRARVAEDWAEAQRQIGVLTNSVTSLGDLVDQAAALDVTQNAEIASLKEERDRLVSEANAAADVLDSIDPDASFPPGGGGETPTEPAPGEGGGGVNPPTPPIDPDVGTGTTPETPPPPPEVTENPPEIGGGDGGTVNPTPPEGAETPNP